MAVQSTYDMQCFMYYNFNTRIALLFHFILYTCVLISNLATEINFNTLISNFKSFFKWWAIRLIPNSPVCYLRFMRD